MPQASSGLILSGRLILGSNSGNSMGIKVDPTLVAGGKLGRRVPGSVESATVSFGGISSLKCGNIVYIQ
jgi:hypothetical protein